jgi:hypothetical protein
MADFEVTYDLSSYCNYVVTSEDLEPMNGQNYNYLSYIGANPNASFGAIANDIIDKFINQCDESHRIGTLGCVDTSKVEALENKLGN